MSSLTVGTINIGQFFNIPVQTQAFIDSITPQEGQIFYNSDANFVQIYANGVWNTTNVGTGNQLYDFTTFTFKGGGRGEAIGPNFNVITAAYAGANWVSQYLTTGDHQGYQLWTVPATATYSIEAGGARGGKDTNYGITDIWGATIKGEFDLQQGQKLEILVGHGGNQYGSPHGNEAGGGGASFVKDYTNDSPLIVAGGGGGSAGNVYGNSCSRNLTDAYGQTTTQSVITTCQGSYTAPTPTIGYGGSGTGQYWGGGGGGWFGDGTNGYNHCGTPTGGKSYINGGEGGPGDGCYTPSGQGNRGGFGGGGGGNLSGPGGGGGYTGGNSSGYWSSYSQHGGGGGSFNAGAVQSNTRGGNSSSQGGYAGAGYVKITKQS